MTTETFNNFLYNELAIEGIRPNFWQDIASSSIDAMTGVLYRDRLVLIGKPAVGRSTLAHYYLQYLTQKYNHEVGVFTYRKSMAEFKKTQIAAFDTKNQVKTVDSRLCEVTGNKYDVILIDDLFMGYQEAKCLSLNYRTYRWIKESLLDSLKPGGKIIILTSKCTLLGELKKDNWQIVDIS